MFTAFVAKISTSALRSTVLSKKPGFRDTPYKEKSNPCSKEEKKKTCFEMKLRRGEILMLYTHN